MAPVRRVVESDTDALFWGYVMKRWVAWCLLCVASGLAHADVYVLDSDSLAATLGARSGSVAHQVKPGDKPGVPLSEVTPRPSATGSLRLIDQSGLQFFINTNITFSTSSSASGAMSEASYTGPVAATTIAGATTQSTLNDAFDGYGTLCVSLTGATGPCSTGDAAYTIYNQNGAGSTECSGRQGLFNAKVIGPLSVSRKVYVPSDDAFGRWMERFTNTSAAPVTFNAIIANNLGSDNNTRIVTTSSGDAVATTGDTWVTTFQNYSGTTSSDVRLGHVMRGAGAPVGLAGVNFVDGDDNPYWSYPLTLAPGQSAILLRFVTGQPSKAAAATQAARLATLPSTALECMTPVEMASIVNFLVGPDLAITKSAPAVVNAGATFAYTLNVSNSGATATNVSVSDPLPAGTGFVSATGTGWSCSQAAGVVTCTQASLGSGAANPITISVNAPGALGSISNTATVSSDGTDTNPANNTSNTTSTSIVSPSLVSGTKTVSGATFVGGSGSYTVTLNNAGAAAQLDNPGNEFTDLLPANLNLVSATATSGTVVATIASRTVAWNGSIPAAGSVTITINFTIASGAVGTVVSNQGTIAYDADGNGSNEASAVTDDPGVAGSADPTSFTITGGASVSGTKTVSGGFNVGDTVAYTIVLSNPSAVAQADNPGHEFTDVLPAALQLQSASATSGTAVATIGTNTVDWDGAIPGGGSVTITITATILPAAAGTTVNNQGTIRYDSDGNGSNDATALTDDPGQGGASDPTGFAVVETSDVGIGLSLPPGQIIAATTQTFGATVSNVGPSAAPGLQVTISFPAGFTVQSITGPGLTCTPAANIATCTSASFAVGSSALSIAVLMPAAAGSYSVTATVSTTGTDPDSKNNAATLPFDVQSALGPAQALPGLTRFGALVLIVALVLLPLIVRRRRQSKV
jgi:uncharacterized repeat protein (TIGR01451 family)